MEENAIGSLQRRGYVPAPDGECPYKLNASLWEPSHVGLHHWKRTPFGLCNATATFQRLMANVLASVTQAYGNLVMCYVNDVIIATENVD